MFDAYIKLFLCRQHGWSMDSHEIFGGLSIDPIHATVIPDAKNVFEAYKRNNHPHLWEITHCSLEPSEAIIEGVPIYGYLDARLNGVCPFDWKTSGYGAKRNVSPKPGYRICNVIAPFRGIFKQAHVRADEPMDLVNPDWATQLLFYHWMINGTKNIPVKGYIHQIIIREDDVLLAIYWGGVSDEFIDSTKKDLVRMWDMYQGVQIDIPDAEPHWSKCHAYNDLCRAAPHCGPFRNWWEAEKAMSK